MCQELFWALGKWQLKKKKKANRSAEIPALVRASHVSLNF